MSGNNNLVITAADRAFIEALDEARVVDRELAAEMLARNVAAVRATNRRLHKLTGAGFLNRFFLGTRAGGMKALYTLGRKSEALLGRPVHALRRPKNAVLVGDQFVHHQLAVNAVFVNVKYRRSSVEGLEFVRWLSFSSELSTAIPLVPDGYFELKSSEQVHSAFVEVDRGTEPHRTWVRKVQLYLQLATSGAFKQQFQQERFRVLVITESERRALAIRKTVAQQVQKVFWFSTLDAINRDGLFAAHWLRPIGDEKHSLV